MNDLRLSAAHINAVDTATWQAWSRLRTLMGGMNPMSIAWESEGTKVQGLRPGGQNER